MGSWELAGKAMAATFRGSRKLTESVAGAVATGNVKPRKNSLRRGILVPGDGPPHGARGSFRDYRNVLLPDNLRALNNGVFPLGRAQHPGKDKADGQIFLDWGEVERHVAIVGPSGSGKTFNLIAPWIVAAVCAGYTTVAVDVKGDLRQEIAAGKSRLGVPTRLGIIPWDVDDPTGSRAWNPLAEVQTPQHAAQVAMAFLGKVDSSDPQKFFAERDHRWLRGLVWLVTRAGPVPHPSILYTLSVDQFSLERLVNATPQASADLQDLVRFDPAKYTDATAGLANRLSWLADPALKTMLDSQAPRAFTLQSAMESSAIVLVGARQSGGERSEMAAAIFLNLLRLKCLERFGKSSVPVFWMLDEAPRYANRIELDQMLDLLRGAHSPVCVAMQDVNQLGSEQDQRRMLANCDTFIALSGTSQSSAKFFSERLGATKKAVASQALDAGGRWKPSLTHQDLPVLGEHEIMYPPVTNGRGGVAQIRSGSPAPFLFSF